MTDLAELITEIFKEYVEHGYLQMWDNLKQYGKQAAKIADLGELGLIHTEVSEAMEMIRDKEYSYQDLGMECADIIIRTMNFMMRKRIDPIYMLRKAIDKNKERAKLHGRAV